VNRKSSLSLLPAFRRVILGVLFVTTAVVPVAQAQVFISRIDLGRLEAYDFDGTFISSFQVGGLQSPFGVAVNDTNVFVVNQGNPGHFDKTGEGTIGKYNLDGSLVNSTLISALGNPADLSLFGTSLYIANGRRVTEYGTDGALINTSLITLAGGHVLRGIAVSPLGVFVVDQDTQGGTGIRIGAYNFDGTTRNASLVTGLASPKDVAVSGTRLFVADDIMNQIGEYNAIDGSLVRVNRITSVDAVQSLAVTGEKLYFAANVGNAGTIGEYHLDGSAVNKTMISGVHGTLGIAVHTASSTVPDGGTTIIMMGAGLAGLAVISRKFARG
jgi:hypothetical protein